MPSSSASANALETARSAVRLSCRPRARETMLPQPMPTVKPTAWMNAMMAKTIPTAPAALVPSRATKKVSAML